MIGIFKKNIKMLVVIFTLSYSLSAQSFWKEFATRAGQHVSHKMMCASVHYRWPMLNWVAYALCRSSHWLGFNINGTQSNGMGLLHLAAFNGSNGAVNALIGYGLDVNACGAVGRTPLHFAARNGHTAVMQTLLAAHANANACDNDHATPLHAATKYGRNQAISLLLAAGANPNVLERLGYFSPLHVAVINNNLAAARLLVRSGAHVNLARKHYDTPKEKAARQQNNEEMMKVLNEQTRTRISFLAGASCDRAGAASPVRFLSPHVAERILKKSYN